MDISNIQATTGVYLFYKKSEIIYIGKSNNLKARVKSHFENAKLDAKEALIVGNATKIKCRITDSDFKAVLLESDLIKKYKPIYNSRWRDDKSYLYIKISKTDIFPKIYPVRREDDDRSLYFGPFSSQHEVEAILKETRRIFPFCMQKKLGKYPCFYHKIGYCNPCPNKVTTTMNHELRATLKREYRKNIRGVIKVLEGNTDLILKNLYRHLKLYSRQQKYEDAIVIRNKISRFTNLIANRHFLSTEPTFYNLSEQNIKSLLNILHPFYPDLFSLSRIECFDVSNSAGKQATASLVVFTEGLVDKSQYRRFKIKNLKLRSDFEMIEEVLTRRFASVAKVRWPSPNLIIIDGGKPQLRFVKRLLSKLAITIPFIGIAKQPDRLIVGANLATIRPHTNNLGFNLIRAIRDESHRFAKKYHVYLRDKKMMI